MPRAGIIYEVDTAAEHNAILKLMMIIGAGRFFKSAEFSPDLRDTYDFYFIGGPVRDNAIDIRITEFMSAHRGWLSTKRVALFAFCPPGARAERSLQSLAKKLGTAVIAKETITVAPEQLDLTELAAIGLRIKALKDDGYVKLPPKEVRAHVETFLNSHKYCTLCTAYGDRVRGTTVTYTYHDGHMYIVCEGATKFANLILNNNVCIALYAPYKGGGLPAGIQLTGTVTILDPTSNEYRRMMEIKGSDYQRLTSLPWILWGLDVKIAKAEFWWSPWSEMGVGPKQEYYFV